MKTKQIKGAVEIILIDDGLHRTDFILGLFLDDFKHSDIAKKGWQFHCRLSEMTEDQAAAMVKTCMNVGWFDYRNKDNGTCRGLDTAKESFQSLLEANGWLPTNPHGKKPVLHEFEWFGDRSLSVSESMVREGHKRNLSEWQEAEANVFPPETTLVFVKQ